MRWPSSPAGRRRSSPSSKAYRCGGRTCRTARRLAGRWRNCIWSATTSSCTGGTGGGSPAGGGCARGRGRRGGQGGERQTTTNRMELTAAIKPLEALDRPATVDLYTDSQYLRSGITERIAKWKKNGWGPPG